MVLNTRTRRIIVAAGALLVFLATARMGLWQLDRAQQKQELQERRSEREQAAPLTAAQATRRADEAPSQWDRRVVLEGRWRPDAAVFLENRVMNGRAGLLLVMPLQMDDGGAVAVQRGWLPADAHNRLALPTVPTPTARVRVTGRMAPEPSPFLQVGEAAGQGRLRQNLSLAAYALETQLALRPWTLQQTAATEAVEPVATVAAVAVPGRSAADATPSRPTDAARPPAGASSSPVELADGLLRDWPAPDLGRAKHLGYAVQWFALSALVAGLYFGFEWIAPRRRRRKAPPPP